MNLVRQQFDGVESELINQQKLNQGILDSHDQNVKDCNVARATAFAGEDGVKALKETMQGARTTHGQCREQEDKDIESMETECGAFQEMQKCDIPDQNWYASSTNSKAGDYKNSLQTVISQAKTCRTKVNKVSTQAAQCDADQDKFTAAFCAYEAKLTATCSELDTCYATAKANKAQADTSIAKLEEEQKTMWRMVQRVHCYLDLLFNVRSTQGTAQMPEQKDIDKCNALTGDELKRKDSEIDLAYEAADEKDLCETHEDNKDGLFTLASPDYEPGTMAWYKGELERYEAHGKLKENTACSA